VPRRLQYPNDNDHHPRRVTTVLFADDADDNGASAPSPTFPYGAMKREIKEERN
jgi:hypothetical protein